MKENKANLKIKKNTEGDRAPGCTEKRKGTQETMCEIASKQDTLMEQNSRITIFLLNSQHLQSQVDRQYEHPGAESMRSNHTERETQLNQKQTEKSTRKELTPMITIEIPRVKYPLFRLAPEISPFFFH